MRPVEMCNSINGTERPIYLKILFDKRKGQINLIALLSTAYCVLLIYNAIYFSLRYLVLTCCKTKFKVYLADKLRICFVHVGTMLERKFYRKIFSGMSSLSQSHRTGSKASALHTLPSVSGS